MYDDFEDGPRGGLGASITTNSFTNDDSSFAPTFVHAHLNKLGWSKGEGLGKKR
ncbi:hypothetical protein HDU76_011729, partial [Blyttiomyces sp. JEL0837]